MMPHSFRSFCASFYTSFHAPMKSILFLFDSSSHVFLFQSVVPDSFPSARLFIARPHAGRSYRGQIVAAQLELRDYDAVTGTRLLQSRLSQWSEELSTSTDKRTPAGAVTYDRRTGRVILRAAPPSDPLAKAQYVPSPAVQSSSPTSANPHRPTLFSLLARLSDSSVTTLEQRFAIRHIVTDYLNNEISHAKVFSYLGQVVGYQALDDIIKSLPVGPPPPGQQTLAVGRIQQNFQMGHPQKSSPGVVVGTAPELTVQRQEGPCFTPSVATETIEGEGMKILCTKLEHIIRSGVCPNPGARCSVLSMLV